MARTGTRILQAVVCALLCAPTHALPTNLTAAQLYHSRWTFEEGAPSGIDAMAQTRDGFLWLSNASGLFRFDGVEFEHIESVGGQPLPSANVVSLWANPQGGLWIGYQFGGASLLQNGRLVSYSVAQGLPGGVVLAFAQSAGGSVWAGTSRGLFHLSDGRWKLADSEGDGLSGYVERLQLDGQGSLWALGGSEVFVLRRGASRFVSVGVSADRADVAGLSAAPDGHVWLIVVPDGVLTIRDLTGALAPVVLSHGPGRDQTWAAKFDRDGNLWTTDPRGLGRIPLEPHPADTASGGSLAKDGRVALTSASAQGILEDREGNLWIGTPNGLDRFRVPILKQADLTAPDMPFTASNAHAPAFPLAAAPAGGIWVATPREYLVRLGAHKEIIGGGPHTDMTCLYLDRRGELWVGATDALWHLRGRRWTVLQRPTQADLTGTHHAVQAMVMDDSGAMWVSVVRKGVYRIVDGTWVLWGGRKDLPAQTATVLTADDIGQLWFGYADNRVAVLASDHVRTLGAAEGLDVGVVLSIVQHGSDVWIGGEHGVARWDGRRFQPVRWQGAVPLNVSGIAFTSEGHVWLSTSRGAICIDAAAIEAWAAGSPPVQYRLLDYLDGIPGTMSVIRPLPTIAVDASDRIWFATNNGVVWTDPAHEVHHGVAPEVFVKTVRADGVSFDLSRRPQGLQLPVRTHNLEIRYTAPSLTMPERVRFRYQLEGSDSDWQEAGTRRQAFYTDLRPGHYRFRVLAANHEGLWNETGASIELDLPPTFTQTRWFLLLCWLAAAVVMWLLFSLRWRRAEAQLRWRLQERLIERERIARDLHDTFLQGMQGLLLRFQSATERIPQQEPARALMEKALDRADEVIAEGRNKVTELRLSADRRTQYLEQALEQYCADLEQIYGVAWRVYVEGVPRELHPVVGEEVEQIGKEALTNAFKHARATSIEVRVTYSASGLLLQVIDDGGGFDSRNPQVAPGHWGLQGMKERAARIRRGRLSISSRVGLGTTVELQIATRLAFRRSRTWWHRLLRTKPE